MQPGANYGLPAPKPENNGVTIGFCSHRPEMVPLIAEWMCDHDAIFLEEPSAAKFDQMLSGSISVSDYLLPLDVEFPKFSSQMCELLKSLKFEGKKIFQVEPFLEILIDIHEFFADGNSPDAIARNSIRYPVYLAEKNATGALLAYYQAVADGDFQRTVAAVKRFAGLDAARFRLRDSLRSQELVRLIKRYPDAFVEAGEMHYPLFQMLRKRLAGVSPVRPVFLYRQAAGSLDESGSIYGPGDQLTLLYIYHPGVHQPDREDLLAARALVHSKIVAKSEYGGDLDRMPHLGNELYCNRIVGSLSFGDCEALFDAIRNADTPEANRLVTDYLDDRSHASNDYSVNSGRN